MKERNAARKVHSRLFTYNCTYLCGRHDVAANVNVKASIQSSGPFRALYTLLPTPYQLISSHILHILQSMREGCSYMSITMYLFIQLSEPEQCRVKKLAKGFNTAAQDSNPSSLSRESEALPLNHCSNS